MNADAKKRAVLEMLGRESRPLALPEIMERLPEGYAERSLRRWLAEWVSEGVVARTGRKRGTRYVLRSSEGTGEVPKEIPEGLFIRPARDALAYVRQPLFKREPTAYRFEWFRDYTANRDHYFSETELAELARHGQRSAGHEPAGTYARRIYNRLLIDLSYNSSRLEGNTYSLVDTERLINEGSGAAGKLDEEKVMILNHREAIRHLVDNAHRLDVSYDEICTLHYLLSDGLVPAGSAGKIRDHGVRVGLSIYVPMEGRDRLEKQMRSIVDKASLIENPHEQSLFLLIHVAYLQAFTDVNKRTARLSANIPLLRHNLVPLSFNLVDKDDYSAAMLAVYEINEPRPLMDLYIASYLRTCREYDATAEAVGFDEIRVRYREQRRDALGEIITRELIGPALERYIETEAGNAVPAPHREDFLEDIREDLREISPQRIAGLGITRQQLQQWLALSSGGTHKVDHCPN